MFIDIFEFLFCIGKLRS